MTGSWNHKTMSLGRFDEKRKHVLLDSRLNLQLKNSKVTIKPDGWQHMLVTQLWKKSYILSLFNGRNLYQQCSKPNCDGWFFFFFYVGCQGQITSKIRLSELIVVRYSNWPRACHETLSLILSCRTKKWQSLFSRER